MEHPGVLEEVARYLQALIDFTASRRFDAERRAALTEFFGSRQVPSALKQIQEDHYSMYLDWFMFDRPLRDTDHSLVRQFVAEHPMLPARIRENLLGCERSVYSSFEIKEINGHCVVVLDLHGEPHDYYAVSEQTATSELDLGDIITTRLIRWDEGYYFCGFIEKWPAQARALFAHEADALRGARLDPRWHYRLALEAVPFRSRSAWVRQKRRQR